MGHTCSTNRTKKKRPAILYEIIDLPPSHTLEKALSDGRQLPDSPISKKEPPRFNIPKLLMTKTTAGPNSACRYMKRHRRKQILKYSELDMK